ncbi:hypothetical protein E2C01_047188 [Portunus trituberculatus]|uniref:Uncharacterized protein n=1 Tax=Portunus trituberculatus TaxID=210409 RepID=A0A5B7G6S3_PORTR|nr:hypothetical protein [Portunus trituberculatus]
MTLPHSTTYIKLIHSTTTTPTRPRTLGTHPSHPPWPLTPSRPQTYLRNTPITVYLLSGSKSRHLREDIRRGRGIRI